MVDRKVISGVVIEVKPDISKLKYKVGQEVYREGKFPNDHDLIKDTIIDIQYLEYDSHINNVRDLRDFDLNKLTDEQKKLLSLTGIVDYWYWKPSYIMASGYKTSYNHQIYTIAK